MPWGGWMPPGRAKKANIIGVPAGRLGISGMPGRLTIRNVLDPDGATSRAVAVPAGALVIGGQVVVLRRGQFVPVPVGSLLVSGGSPVLNVGGSGQTAFDFYVATTGNDNNLGTSGSPFRTIGKALAVVGATNVLVQIGVRGGFYDELLINPVVRGLSWTNKVRIANYGTEVVWLKPTGGTLASHCIALSSNQSFLEFDGINVDASVSPNEANAMQVEDATGGAHHIRWMNAEWIGKIGAGGHHETDAPNIIACHQVGAGASGGNEFINLRVHHSGGPGDGAYAFYISTNDTLIDGCEMYDTSGYGIQFYNGNGFVCDRFTVRRCYIHDINRGSTGPQVAGIILYGANIRNGVLCNNIIDSIGIGGTATDGIGIVVGSGSFGHSIAYHSIYNTLGSLLDLSGAGSGGLLQNLAAWSGGGGLNGGASWTKVTNDINSGGADPGFVNAAAGNFHLTSGSRLRGQGTAIGSITSVDKDNVARGNNPDIGAYQFV